MKGLTSYPEIVEVLDLLPTLVREKRRRDGLNLREASTVTGVSAMLLSRFERGGGIYLEHARTLLLWVAAVPSVERGEDGT